MFGTYTPQEWDALYPLDPNIEFHIRLGLEAPSLTCLSSDPSGQLLFLVPNANSSPDLSPYDEYMEKRREQKCNHIYA